MIHQFGADLLYLLNIINDMGYMILFVVVMIWVCLLLQVVEAAIAPLRTHPHKLVHPLPSSLELKTFGQSDKPTESVTTLESSSEVNRRKSCA
jgi:hypothetical protein